MHNRPVDFLDLSPWFEIPSLLTPEVVLFCTLSVPRRPGLGPDVSGKWSDFCVVWLSKHPGPKGSRVKMIHPFFFRGGLQRWYSIGFL